MRDKSEANWKLGIECLNKGHVNAAANRLYYSVFQAVQHYATLKENYVYIRGQTRAHGEMRNYVRNNKIGAKQFERDFQIMMGLRETADYDNDTPEKYRIEQLIEGLTKIRKCFFEMAE
jgi:uncharacterized protein (UPF0332 family)